MISKVKYFIISIAVLVIPSVGFAQERLVEMGGGLAPEGVSRPLVLLMVLAGLTLLPILAMMSTSFVKLVVVLSMLRNALGTQQVPPTVVITGLAMILTVYVMAPVGIQMYEDAQETIQTGTHEALLSQASVNLLLEGMDKAKEPMRAFLVKNSHEEERELFVSLQSMMMPKTKGDKSDAAKKYKVTSNDFMVLIPAFVISELTEAFQIAFILFLPFLIIDIVVSNVLLALGMFMVPPVTMALPIKLLLFVTINGWHILTKALLMGYA